MKLSALISSLNGAETKNFKDCEIKDVTADSNSVTRGSLFICIRGGKYDGHDYARQAENYGASAIVAERPVNSSLPLILVKDARAATTVLAFAFHGNPQKSLRLIGVTGTNGKTTTTHLITSALSCAGIKCGLIGTLGVYYDGRCRETDLTTPDPLELAKIFAEMRDAGVEAVVMEVSAHAVYLKKVFGLEFEIGVFTNLTQDHLDFFGDMESYAKAKTSFFSDNKCKYVVSNSDDKVGVNLGQPRSKTLYYGIENPADVFAIEIKERENGSSFVLNLFDCIYEINLNLSGIYNVYNALAAATAAALFGVPPDKVAEGLENVKGVSGRLENVEGGEFPVFIDYAHTPDGLEKSLKTLKPFAKKRLILVFGCGGDRDKGKRPLMGEIAVKNADMTVITTDNPRYEEPMEIISQIEEGAKRCGGEYLVIQDRKDAIFFALEQAKKGDIVLIAGKGGEKYQDVFGIKKPFCDKDCVEEFFRRNK